MWNEISAKSATTIIVGTTTYIPMNKNWRTRNIRARTDIIKGATIMAIDD